MKEYVRISKHKKHRNKIGMVTLATQYNTIRVKHREAIYTYVELLCGSGWFNFVAKYYLIFVCAFGF